MGYKPTGQPVGRPRKDGRPAGLDKFAGGLCRVCFPDGWPKGADAGGCGHGYYEKPKPEDEDE